MTNSVASDPAAPDHFIADDGVRIPLHVSGSGPALVLVPGWVSRWQDWQPVVNLLKSRFTCYLWEARPHHSAAETATLARMGRDLHNMLDACGLPRPIVLGHSMGALTCWEYLRHHGDGRLAALCLIDQSPRVMGGEDWDLGLYGGYTAEQDADFVAALRHDFADTIVEKLLKRSRDGMVGNAMIDAMLEQRRQYLRSLAPAPWIAAWQSLVAQDYRDVLPTIGVPTLLAYGAACRYYGPRVADYVHATIPNSRLRLYENAGHSPHLELPDAFVRDFVEFAEQIQ